MQKEVGMSHLWNAVDHGKETNFKHAIHPSLWTGSLVEDKSTRAKLFT